MYGGDIRRQQALFAISDCAAVAAAFVTAHLLHDPKRFVEQQLSTVNPVALALAIVTVGMVWFLVFHACELYRMRSGELTEQVAIAKACTIAMGLSLPVLFVVHVQDLPRQTVAYAYVLSIVFVLIGRSVTRSCLRRWYTASNIAIPLVIIGFNSTGHYLLDQLLNNPGEFQPVGFLDAEGGAAREYRGFPLLGTIDLLPELKKMREAFEVVIAMPAAPREEQEKIISLCRQARLNWWIVPWIMQSLTTGARVDMLGVLPVVGPRRSNISGLNYVLKRGVDLFAASVLLVLAIPLILLASAIVWISDGSPVLFRQTRVGRHGKPFQLLKLRTMYRDANDDPHREYVRSWIRNGTPASVPGANGAGGKSVFKMTRDSRIIPGARLLRKFSIDELPQLINVWRGEMSLIGPRPALPYEIEHYDDVQRRRLEAVPGITGLWQVSGRNHLSFGEMVRLDLQYLDEWSLAGDLRILLRTVPTLLRGSGL